MPHKALKPCRHSGCPNLTDDLYCTEHKPMHPDRPSASKRGYSSKWQKVSRAYLRRNPLCVRCLAGGRYIQATVTDHIIPICVYLKEKRRNKANFRERLD